MKPSPSPSGEPVRIQKFLSDAGVASRRHAEELIEQGRVLVNDEIIEKLPVFVDPDKDVVIVNGTRVRPRPLAYFLTHKPKGVVCTNFDPDGRPRAIDLLPPDMRHLFVVGRLDEFTTGLLIMTNDGELATRVTHPRYGIQKLYKAEVQGEVPGDIASRLRRGVHLSDGKVQAGQVKVLKRSRQQSTLEMTMLEGRSSGVRRALARLGHKVLVLKRVRIGPVSLGELPIGACRLMTPHEVAALWKAVREAEASGAAAPRGGKRRRFRPAGGNSRTGEPRRERSTQFSAAGDRAPRGAAPARRSAAPSKPRSARRASPPTRRDDAPRGPSRRIVE